MCFFGLFRKKKRQIKSTDLLEFESFYVYIMYKVRSFSSLSIKELEFVKKLPNEKLSEIIDIYNSHALTMMEIYEPELSSCSQGINFSQRC